MTALSVNLNKIALLRNSRGRDYPNVVEFAMRFLEYGVDGITIHPRPDQRHIKTADVYALGELLSSYDNAELNVEGYPSDAFMQLIATNSIDQVTLVPDAESQLTSDHGWDLHHYQKQLKDIVAQIHDYGSRTAVFINPDAEQMQYLPAIQVDRIELYTESYANAFGSARQEAVWSHYANAVNAALAAGVQINAGHDLDLNNLASFLSIGNILEVSIGHALTVECLELGMEQIIQRYLAICAGFNPSAQHG